MYGGNSGGNRFWFELLIARFELARVRVIGTRVYCKRPIFTQPHFESESFWNSQSAYQVTRLVTFLRTCDASKDRIQKIKTNNQQQQQKETKNKDNEKIILMTVMTFTIVIRSLNDKYCGPKSQLALKIINDVS